MDKQKLKENLQDFERNCGIFIFTLKYVQIFNAIIQKKKNKPVIRKQKAPKNSILQVRKLKDILEENIPASPNVANIFVLISVCVYFFVMLNLTKNSQYSVLIDSLIFIIIIP